MLESASRRVASTKDDVRVDGVTNAIARQRYRARVHRRRGRRGRRRLAIAVTTTATPAELEPAVSCHGVVPLVGVARRGVDDMESYRCQRGAVGLHLEFMRAS